MIHHVFANRSNIGDWLSAIGIQSLLPPQVPLVEHLCDDPFVSETLRSLENLGSDDAVIIGGGGLLMDYFLPFWLGLEQIELRAALYVWGVGYCDLKVEVSRPPIELLRRVLARARRCWVRDEISRRLLDLPMMPPASGCPSLLVVNAPPTEGFGVLHVDNYTTAGAAAYDAMDAAARAFATATGRLFRRTNNRIESGRRAEMEEILDSYAASDIVLSSALHGCIIAATMGRRVLAVSGDRKIEGFMDTIGLGDWVLSVEDVADVPDRLRSIEGQISPALAIDELRKRQKAIGREIGALLQRSETDS